jgi:DNA-directed RNA polymerase specialized sigma24 family protein
VIAKRDSLDPMDELARLLALNLKREHGLADVIVELDGVGYKQGRIAELLGTSAGYVNVALARANDAEKKKATKKGAKAS